MVLIALLIISTAQGEIIYVDDDGPADFINIQAAINDSNDGDIIIVNPGTYTGEGNCDIDFHGKAITVRSVDTNDPDTVAATIIDCNGIFEEPHRGFYFHSGEDFNSVLSGLTITNGYAGYGGGIYCVSSHPTIANCIFRDNTAQYWGEFSTMTPNKNSNSLVNDDSEVHINIPPPLPGWRGKGGGICCRLSSPTLTNCKFIGNSAYEYGGGMLNYYFSNPILTNCNFSANSALYAAGICNWDSSPTLTNCTFRSNTASRYGGAMENSQSSPRLYNCIFTGNSAGWDGGCMYNYHCNPILINCTFSGNSAGYGGVIFNSGSDATLSNCILWKNTAIQGNEIYLYFYTDFWGSEIPSTINVDYSDVGGGASGVYVDTDCTLNWGEGNIDADPCFVDVNSGDYHLKSQAGRLDVNSKIWIQDELTSPCIDAGDWMNPIGLEPFPNGGRVNMGAYGGTADASKSYFGGPVCKMIVAGDINGDCKVNFLDFRLMALHWLEDYNPPTSPEPPPL